MDKLVVCDPNCNARNFKTKYNRRSVEKRKWDVWISEYQRNFKATTCCRTKPGCFSTCEARQHQRQINPDIPSRKDPPQSQSDNLSQPQCQSYSLQPDVVLKGSDCYWVDTVNGVYRYEKPKWPRRADVRSKTDSGLSNHSRALRVFISNYRDGPSTSSTLPWQQQASRLIIMEKYGSC